MWERLLQIVRLTASLHWNSFGIETLSMSFMWYVLLCTLVASFLGGLSLQLNHLIAERMSAPYWPFGTLPIGIFLSNLVSGQLETSLMTFIVTF